MKDYATRINPATLDKIAAGLHNHIVATHRYRDPHLTARDLAALLHTNAQYIAAAVSARYGVSFPTFIGRLRVEDAKRMLDDKECTLQISDIAAAAGFATRQSFYNAFFRHTGMKPGEYRSGVRIKECKD